MGLGGFPPTLPNQTPNTVDRTTGVRPWGTIFRVERETAHIAS
ncbi:uncharacterized protein METZ01_LOCUS158621 [marine metagenome]|uniref:Uncharacterized protein n=1 Tax=marine metagenome TaxID=408172 RepID=A0A382AXR7_9ZZZZ